MLPCRAQRPPCPQASTLHCTPFFCCFNQLSYWRFISFVVSGSVIHAPLFCCLLTCELFYFLSFEHDLVIVIASTLWTLFPPELPRSWSAPSTYPVERGLERMPPSLPVWEREKAEAVAAGDVGVSASRPACCWTGPGTHPVTQSSECGWGPALARRPSPRHAGCLRCSPSTVLVGQVDATRKFL